PFGPDPARMNESLKMKQILWALPVLLAASACVGDETVRAYGGAEKTWMLESLDGTAFAAEATMLFPQTGQIAGKAPCNSYTGAMDAPYPWFETGPLASTRMLCPDQAAEDAFFQALGQMRQVEVLGDTLILSTEDGREMVFKADG
ncbi:MAG: META domain-containing protein, partial [Pseudomonadota bacterium]